MVPPETTGMAMQTLADRARDELWKSQLREEHRALLDQLYAVKQAAEQKDAEYMRLIKLEQDACAELGDRLSKLERVAMTLEQVNRLNQTLNDYKAERDRLSSSGLINEGRERLEQRVAAKDMPQSRFTVLFTPDPVDQSTKGALSPLPASFLPSPTITAPNRPPLRALPHNDLHATTHYTDSTTEHQLRPTVRIADFRPASGGPQQERIGIKNDGKTTNERSLERALKRAQREQPQEPQRRQTRNGRRNTATPTPQIVTASSTVVKPQSLRQGRKPMSVYHREGSDTFFKLSITDREAEYDFVNRFLKGIERAKDRAAATEVFVALYESRVVNKRLRVECRWDQVGRGLVQAQLLPVEGCVE